MTSGLLFILTVGGCLGGWALLAVLGTERQRLLQQARAEAEVERLRSTPPTPPKPPPTSGNKPAPKPKSPAAPPPAGASPKASKGAKSNAR